MRAERREKAREQAQKLPVKILAPIMIFLLPAVMVIVLAPAVFTMFKAF
jgi:tight adherence protein C